MFRLCATPLEQHDLVGGCEIDGLGHWRRSKVGPATTTKGVPCGTSNIRPVKRSPGRKPKGSFRKLLNNMTSLRCTAFTASVGWRLATGLFGSALPPPTGPRLS